jgi:Cof subfamily protein (haloacid dehalogenase superfamily)
MPIKLVALDIDGTLLDSRGELPPENAEAIAYVVRQGIKLILVTGRRWGMGRRVSQSLQLPFPLVVHNGALIKSPVTSTTLSSCFIDQETATAILAATKDYLPYTILHRDWSVNGQMVVHPACLENLIMQNYLAQLPESVLPTASLAGMIDPDLIQVMFGGELTIMLEIEKALQASGWVDRVKLTKTYYPERNLGILDLLHNNCSKRAALQFLAAYYGVQREEILAIGDNHNDLEMLEYAGTGVVVANCVDDLKGRGFWETSSNNACGVAKALRRYID